MQYSPHWWLTEFRSVPIVPGAFSGDMSRAFTVETLAPTGTPFGLYRLDGTRSRMSNQAVSFEFTYPSRCFDRVGQWFNTLLAAGQSEGTLKKTDGRTVLETQASITTIRDATTIDDLGSGIKRTALTFTAEPFWYGPLKTYTFSNEFIWAVQNAGNARAIKHLVISVTDNLSGTELAPHTITANQTYGTTATLDIAANLTGPVVIDCGANTVTANGVNAYASVRRPATQLPLLYAEGAYLSNGRLVDNATFITFETTVSGTVQLRDTWV